jgi:hypothetical protein
VNASRYWTYLTSIICENEKELDDEIPDNEYFLEYGPGYELSISKRNVKDLNKDTDLEIILETIKGKGKLIKPNIYIFYLLFYLYNFIFYRKFRKIPRTQLLMDGHGHKIQHFIIILIFYSLFI